MRIYSVREKKKKKRDFVKKAFFIPLFPDFFSVLLNGILITEDSCIF